MIEKRAARRLTAILAADVAGYTRLVAQDEEGTLARLRAHLAELFQPQIADHSGRIIKTMGDGVLAEFASVVEAMRCAVALQRGMAQRNAALPEDHRIAFRIGLHSGDVVIDGADILGDGVNVAARLQAAAEIGGISVSDRVQEDTQGRVDVVFEDLGEQRFKNIDRPIHAFRVRLDDIRPVPSPAAAPSDRPSIAVLPFQNISGDAEQDYFAEALSEDIGAALSRWRWFFVIDRNSSAAYAGRGIDIRKVGRELGVRYVLQGRVRRSGNRIRVSAQLIDAAQATNLWGDNFDRDIVDIFALQDDVTERVVGSIEPAMLQSETVRVVRQDVSDWSAFDCVQRGMWHFNRMSRDSMGEALAQFRQAIRRDPGLALGYIGLARTLYGAVIYGWSGEAGADLEEAARAAHTAIRLDPRDAYGHFALAGAALYLGRHKEALAEARKTVELNPNLAFGHFRLGQVLIYTGNGREAVAPIERSMVHSPYDPQMGAMRGLLALAHYHAGDYHAALEHAQTALALNNRRSAGVLAASLARLDRSGEIPPSVRMLLRARPADYMPVIAPYERSSDLRALMDGIELAARAAPVENGASSRAGDGRPDSGS